MQLPGGLAWPTLQCFKKKKKKKRRTLRGYKEKNSAWQALMSDQKLGRSESRGARRCVVTPSSATQRWDKDTPAWGWVNGRTGEKRRNETRGEAIALTPLAARRAPAWPFISATCEDERGGREGKVEGGPPQAIVCCLAWSRPAKWGSDRGGLLRGSAVSRKSKEKERKKKNRL